MKLGLIASRYAALISFCCLSSMSAFAQEKEIQKVREEIFGTDINAENIREIDLKSCADQEKDAILGVKTCQDSKKFPNGFISTLKKATQYSLGVQNTNYYKGLKTNFTTGRHQMSPVPVCNLAAGEKDKNSIGMSCGKFCKIDVDTSLVGGGIKTSDQAGHCDREYGWYRGAWVQALNYAKEKTLNQLHSRKFQLTDYDGSRPCAEEAADLMRSQRAIQKTVQDIKGLYKGKEKDLEKLVCDSTISTRKIAMADKDVKDPKSHSVCKMQMTELRLESLWSKFLMCEIHARATLDFEKELSNPGEFLASARSAIQPMCEEAIKCKKGGNKVFTACTDDRRTKLLNECYRREMPKWFQKRLDRWKTSTPVEFQSHDASKRPAKDSGPFENVAIEMSLFAFLSLIKPRKRKPAQWIQLIKSNAHQWVLVFTFCSFVFSGCNCDDNKMECLPCKETSQQTKGCLLNGCLSALYTCISLGNANGHATGKESRILETDAKDFDRKYDNRSAFFAHVCITPENSTDQGALNLIHDPQFLEMLLSKANDQTDFNKEDRKRNFESYVKSLQASYGAALKVVPLEEAQGNCREAAGIPRDVSGEGEEYKAVAENNATSLLTAEQKAAMEEAILNRAKQPQTAEEMAQLGCPSTPTPGGWPSGGGGGDSNGIAQDLADVRDLFGLSNVDAEKTPLAEDNQGGGAASEGYTPYGNGAPNDSAKPMDPSTGFPKVQTTAGGFGASDPSAHKGLGGDFGAGKEELAAFAEEEKPKELTTGTEFEATENTVGGPKNSGSSLFNLSGAGDAGIGRGVSSADFGTGSGGIQDLESYLSANNKWSLFEIVNKRMDQWSTELEK